MFTPRSERTGAEMGSGVRRSVAKRGTFLGLGRCRPYDRAMRILGVDPGTRLVGYGCLDLQEGGRRGPGEVPAAGLAGVSANTPTAHRVSNLASVTRTKISFVAAGVLRLGRSSDPVVDRLHRLGDEMRRLIAEFGPDELALEEAYFGKSVQSALRIGESRGVILAEAGRAGLVVSQFSPARVKRSVAGSGSASKDQVAFMVRQTLRLSTVREDPDETDALAIGLCCIESKRSFRH